MDQHFWTGFEKQAGLKELALASSLLASQVGKTQTLHEKTSYLKRVRVKDIADIADIKDFLKQNNVIQFTYEKATKKNKENN